MHTEEQLSYALRKIHKFLIQLYPVLKEKLEEAGLTRVAQIEFDCLPMTVEAMQTGLPLDIPGVQVKIASLTQIIDDGEAAIKTIAKDAG